MPLKLVTPLFRTLGNDRRKISSTLHSLPLASLCAERARFVAQRHVVPIGLAARLANADPLRSSGHNPHAARAFSEQIAFGGGAAGG